ncbi:MAG: hypothetical protein R3194_01320 [Limnobacter sp.]|nr:hypothetical protein [Limnobacter sp.]
MALKRRGFLLMELALVLALMVVVSVPLLQLQKTARQAASLEHEKAIERNVSKALDAFVAAHGRLPCPAQAGGLEARTHQQCDTPVGNLPVATLGLAPSDYENWQLTIASFEQAGSTAAHQLVRDTPFDTLSVQAFTQIAYQPVTPSNGLEGSALPAIHACLLASGAPLPEVDQRGCGTHPLHFVGVVAFASRQSNPIQAQLNASRVHQVFLQPEIPNHGLIWMSLEQFIWIKTLATNGI